MAYLSSTSTAPNTPSLFVQAIARPSSSVTGSTLPGAGGVPRQWQYSSTHGATAVQAANFFTDGNALGMRTGDVLFVYGSTFGVTTHMVIDHGATSFQVSAPVVVGSTA